MKGEDNRNEELVSEKITLCGRRKDIDTLLKMLRHIEYLGLVGASRNILARVDGDGAGRINVYKENGSRIDKEKYNINQNNLINSCVGVYDIG